MGLALVILFCGHHETWYTNKQMLMVTQVYEHVPVVEHSSKELVNNPPAI